MPSFYGRAPVSQCCVHETPHGHWQILTTRGAIQPGGVIREEMMLIDGAMNADTFLAYTERCLAPSLRSGDVAILDEPLAPKTAGVIEAIAAVDASVWLLRLTAPT